MDSMIVLTFRPLTKRPPGWDREPSRPSPFSSTYISTLELLDRELAHLGARDTVVLQVDASERTVRRDGSLRADAKVNYPGVILSFNTRRYGSLTYPCNAFRGQWGHPGWQANLRAIALGLEALRKVERYGIAERGQQYAGWAELPSGIPLGPRTMTVDEAARILATAARDCDGGDLVVGATGQVTLPAVERAYKQAVKLVHPDAGGDHDAVVRLTEATELLRQAAQ